MTQPIQASATPRSTSDSLRWSARCLAGQAVFQLTIAVLLFLDRDEAIASYTGHGFTPTRSAAEGAVVGALGVHLLLAVLSIVFAFTIPRGRRSTRILATVMLVAIAIGGIAAMRLPGQTYLSPIGVVLALGALYFLWRPARHRSGT